MSKLSSASESLYLRAFPLRKRTSLCCTHFPANVKLHGQQKCPSYCLSFQGDHERTSILFRRKNHLCHALPLPSVTTGNDSDGSASLSSTCEYEGKVWAEKAKHPDVLTTFQQSIETLNKVYEETKRSMWTAYGMNVWQRMPAWIKLPTGIFLPWFLFVSAFYGPSVSMDLLPLWIIGPLMVGLLVKMSMKMSAACRQWLADKMHKETALRVIEGARTGQWLEVAFTKIMDARLQIMEKASKWVFFIQSGRFIVVLKQYMYRKLMEWWEARVDNFQDWRLVYFRWERFLKNIV